MEFYRREIKGLKPGELVRLREEYRARVAARRDLSNQQVPAKEAAKAPPEKAIDPRNVEEIRQHAVKAWLRLRAKEAEGSLEKGGGNEVRQPRPGEQYLHDGPSSERSSTRNVEQRQHAELERDANPAGERGRGADREPDRDRASHQGRAREQGIAPEREVHAAVSPGLDDDFGL